MQLFTITDYFFGHQHRLLLLRRWHLPQRTSSRAGGAASTPIFAAVDEEKEDNGSILNAQILDDGNNVVNDFELDIRNPINIDKLRRRLRPYKTNVDVENAMTKLS